MLSVGLVSGARCTSWPSAASRDAPEPKYYTKSEHTAKKRRTSSGSASTYMSQGRGVSSASASATAVSPVKARSASGFKGPASVSVASELLKRL